jgi:hypothetical protein
MKSIIATQTSATSSSHVSKPADPWIVIEYEVKMFRAALDILLRHTFPFPAGSVGRVLNNAVVESAVLHTRNLCEVFLPGGNPQPDDITLTGLFADWGTNPRYDRAKDLINPDLGAAYGKSNTPGALRFDFNKRVAHSTTHRAQSSGYNYGLHLTKLEPIILDIIREFENLRGVPFNLF